MSLLRKMAKAMYEEHFDGLIGCCEPPFESLPEDFIERLERSLLAAFKVMSEHSVDND